MLLPLLLIALPILSAAQNVTQPSALTSYLTHPAESTGETSVSPTILGQTLDLTGPFTLTVLTNTTHALVTFNVSKTVSAIGWLGMGFGTSMMDSAIVVLWPDEETGEWVISERGADGYRMPTIWEGPASEDEEVEREETASFEVVNELSSTGTLEIGDNTEDYTTISFIRPLSLPLAQTLFDPSSTSGLNISNSAEDKQGIIWAYSDGRPESTDVDSRFGMHDAGMFGSEKVDLSVVFNAGEEVDESREWTKYDLVVLSHAAVAMFIWLLVAPAAVIVGRLGRGWSKWFKVHSGMQGYVVVPGTFLIAALGMLASYLGYDTEFTAHKFVGFTILFLVLAQVMGGYWSHKTRDLAAKTRPWYNIAHMIVGISTIVLAFVQIWLGFGEYQGRTRPGGVTIIYAVFIALFLGTYFTSLTLSVLSRRRADPSASLSSAFLNVGLGEGEVAQDKPWVTRTMDRWVSGEEDKNVGVGELPVSGALGTRGDLSAWK
ncbi:hypothetical protein P7C70_g1655, partial [Phenoliferia sp. Uapishka_3]